jgi:hypothetical protein
MLLQIPNNQRFPKRVADGSEAMKLSPSILQSQGENNHETDTIGAWGDGAVS